MAVGFAYTGSGITAARFESNTFTSLGSLGGSVGTAYDINSVGDIVGWSRTTAGENHAFLYTAGSMLDLNTMTNLPSGWILTNAVGINDAGSIAASATYGGLSYAVVLTAIPEPSTYVALVGGLALLSVVAIKRRNLRMAQ